MAAVLGASGSVRHPKWVITYQHVDITADISAMVTEVEYTDYVAHYSDELHLTLEDRDSRWQGPWSPQRGDVVTLQIGYDGEALLPCGDFQVDELELTGPPDAMHLRCIAAGITPSIRTPRWAAYEDATLQQIAQTIAARHQMTLTAASVSLDLQFARVTQSGETDLAFLRRLAQAHNYEFSIRGNVLVFYSREQLEQAVPVDLIVRTQVEQFVFRLATQRVYKAATVSYQNPSSKTLITQSIADDSAPTGDVSVIATRCENPQQARLKATAAIHATNMLQMTTRTTVEGSTVLVAGNNVGIQGFGAMDGIYQLVSSIHRLDRRNGYVTEIAGRRLLAAA